MDNVTSYNLGFSQVNYDYNTTSLVTNYSITVPS